MKDETPALRVIIRRAVLKALRDVDLYTQEINLNQLGNRIADDVLDHLQHAGIAVMSPP